MDIQSKIKVHKSQRNDFGKYNFRNLEDILEAVKPLLLENKCVIIFDDGITEVSGRHYLSTKAILIDVESGEKVSVPGIAREEESKKGMDGSQVTGASSSYARKYACNALFAIDDTKDSDSTNGSDPKETKNSYNQDKKDDFVIMFEKLSKEQQEWFCKKYPSKYGPQKEAKYFNGEQRKEIIKTLENKKKESV